eukprot:366046-Amphidinium_carterae.1
MLRSYFCGFDMSQLHARACVHQSSASFGVATSVGGFLVAIVVGRAPHLIDETEGTKAAEELVK